jgi:hypothetical protein
MKSEKRTMEPGLHLQVWTGTPDYVKSQLRDWFREEEPLMIISASHGFSGSEFWMSIVYQQIPKSGILGATMPANGRGM